MFSCSIFLDFSKAFDRYLEHYGFRGIAYLWLKSYLTKRTQTVAINGVYVNELTINCGVPQGSVLGPLDLYK